MVFDEVAGVLEESCDCVLAIGAVRGIGGKLCHLGCKFEYGFVVGAAGCAQWVEVHAAEEANT